VTTDVIAATLDAAPAPELAAGSSSPRQTRAAARQHHAADRAL
jgi:hypothetical protein